MPPKINEDTPKMNRSLVESASGPWVVQQLHPEVPKVAAKALAVPKADVAPKAPAVVLEGVIVAKLSEVISESKSKEEKDEAYNKLKLEEVKQFLDTMSTSNIMKAVSEILLTAEDDELVKNLLNLLLDGLGESTKHGNEYMMYAVMKTIFKNMKNLIKMKALRMGKFADIIGVLFTHTQCQFSVHHFTKKQFRAIVAEMARLLRLM